MSKNVCHGVNNNDFGPVTFDRDCSLVGLRLVHVSGAITYPYLNTDARWGNNGGKWTLITNSSKQIIFPGILDPNLSAYAMYQLDGFGINDDLIFFNRGVPYHVVQGDVLQVWWASDFSDNSYSENNYVGRHCMDVDVSCLV